MTDNNKKIELDWHFLRYYSLVRLLIALFFLLSPLYTDLQENAFNPALYNSVAISYLIIASLLLFISLAEQRFFIMSIIQPMVDILMLALLAYSGISSSSGYVILMGLVSILAILLLRHRMALLYGIAAAASLLLVSYLKNDSWDQGEYMEMALQSFAILSVSLLGNILARRLTNYEAEVSEQYDSLLDMRELNSEIINKMNHGILVIDDAQHTLYINKMAWFDLGYPNNPIGKPLKQISQDLSQQMKAPYKIKREGEVFRATKTGPKLLPIFVALPNQRLLIMLEDYSNITKRVQQEKLASLGQLTASIAHEIRNPLSAINQASEILSEVESSSSQEKELAEIIHRQCQRINGIIENVQMVSQRKSPQRQALVLSRFLENFINEFKQGYPEYAEINVTDIDPELKVHFDQSQLKQVLSNLFENGLKYSYINSNNRRLHLTAGNAVQGRQFFLDILDEGPGITVEEAHKIFEPFYTTNHDGTGLGLYISRELCEANKAHLDCVPIAFGGACFRISFDDDHYE